VQRQGGKVGVTEAAEPQKDHRPQRGPGVDEQQPHLVRGEQLGAVFLAPRLAWSLPELARAGQLQIRRRSQERGGR
jgi:hypothetical protein